MSHNDFGFMSEVDVAALVKACISSACDTFYLNHNAFLKKSNRPQFKALVKCLMEAGLSPLDVLKLTMEQLAISQRCVLINGIGHIELKIPLMIKHFI